jgi:hypothetical protein
MKLQRVKTITMGILRVSLYLACAGGVAAWVTYVQARDRVDHVLGELGIGLLAELGQLEAGVEQVELNGQPFTFGAAVSEQDPDALVASFEAQCADASGTLEEDLGPLVAEAQKRGHKLPEKPLDQWFTTADRSDDGQAARGACFVRPGDKASNSLWDRLESFANTGHLGKIGGFRYLRADRADDASTTRVLAISSEGDFDIEAMLPDVGDARGSDPVVAARPPKSVRTFSARVSGRSQGAYLYASQATPAEVIAHYDQQLGKQRKLNRVELPDVKGKQRQDARVYASGDGAVVLSVLPDEDEEGASVVTILEIGELADQKRGG